ncbi:MAG: HAMP domain-containing protein [Deltaproteobacteria bacterium]|jgi:PAS domain S-box-containing protein|nr:HAMP domain-containing protein [Deltaproteobacteria bacterium]
MLKFSFTKKVLFAFSVLSLLPLLALAIFATKNLDTVEELLLTSAIKALDQQAADHLELRAIMVANEVSNLLNSVENDLESLSQLAPTAENLIWFSQAHQRSIWTRTGTNDKPIEDRSLIPLYHEIAYINALGFEQVRVVDGQLVDDLRNVSIPPNTTYLTETYFNNAKDLPAGQIYVSHLTGWHVNKAEQLQGAATPLEAVEGRKYEGVIRFARPVRNAQGNLEGVVVLSLDHRHLMEFTQHITPASESFVVFPSYKSGNYAFMFDNEGWIITHPKFWDIRGLDQEGHLVPAYSQQSTAESIEKGNIPYNLRAAAFVHPNYPLVHQSVLGGRSGVIDVTNVGGSQKIMAFAPIFYGSGPYAETGVFGGITIGAEVSQFHKVTEAASFEIQQRYKSFIIGAWVLIGLTALMVLVVAYHLSDTVTRPLSSLISVTKEMARGNLKTRVVIDSPVEVAELAEAFNTMAQQLNERRERLMKSLSDLRQSRYEILQERDLKKTIVENVEVGILTLNDLQMVTSLNETARSVLGLSEIELHTPIMNHLLHWPEFAEVFERCRDQERWNEYVKVERKGQSQTYRLALHPLSSGRLGGHIMTIEDLTERVNLRQQMARIERLASLGRLSAGIAHEVRNPLTGISLLLDELHDRMLGQPNDRNLIQKALCEIERLEGLVSELLNFASGQNTMLSQGDISGVLKDTLFLIRKQCQKQNVELL